MSLFIWMKPLNFSSNTVEHYSKEEKMGFFILTDLIFSSNNIIFYVYLQNTIIFLEYVDFWSKIYLIVYPFLGNLTTHITILTRN